MKDDHDNQLVLERARQIEARLPEHLYKYRSLQTEEERSRVGEMIRSSSLFACKHAELNDPFDSGMGIDWSAAPEVIRNLWLKMMPPDTPNLEWGIENFIRAASDPVAQEYFNHGLAELRQDGVFCLTEKPDDLLMWTYYADGHKGICLRFRAHELWELGLFVPVEYSVKYPHLSYYHDHIEMLYAMMGTKAEQWVHEKEWRLVVNKSGAIAFPPSMLDGIIVGCRTPPDDVRLIKDLAAKHDPPIQVFKALKMTREYGLRIVPIEEGNVP